MMGLGPNRYKTWQEKTEQIRRPEREKREWIWAIDGGNTPDY